VKAPEGNSLQRFPLLTWTMLKASIFGALVLPLAKAFFDPPLSPFWLHVFTWLSAVLLLLELPYLIIASRARASGSGTARRLLLVGASEKASEFMSHLSRRHLNLEVVGIIEREPEAVRGDVAGAPVLGTVKDLPWLIRRLQVDDVIFLVSRTWIQYIEEPLRLFEQAGMRVLLSTDMYPFSLSSMRLEQVGDLPLLAFEPPPHSELALTMKDVLDFCLGALLVLLAAPLSLLIALGIKLTSPGPVFFKQVRSGLNGHQFVMWKFRTMVDGAEQMRRDLEPLNEESGPVLKMENDPRVTLFGNFLRRSSLDELPQLLNVLRGEMSLVGPRPPLPDEVAQYDYWQRRRLSVKPGITCIWQTSGRNKVSFEKWMRMDMEYIDNWSLWLDLKLLLRTVPAVLMGTGR